MTIETVDSTAWVLVCIGFALFRLTQNTKWTSIIFIGIMIGLWGDVAKLLYEPTYKMVKVVIKDGTYFAESNGIIGTINTNKVLQDGKMIEGIIPSTYMGILFEEQK